MFSCYIHKVLNFTILTLMFTTAFAQEHTVGFLRTKYETYQGELGQSQSFIEMLEGLENNVILIDYNELVNNSNNNLDQTVRNFIQANNITKVIIPGNNYSLNVEPIPPNTNRQDVTAILAQMAHDQLIYLMGICGGLQGIAYADGIRLTKVSNISNNIKQHTVSNKEMYSVNVPLNEVKITPSSKLGLIIKDYIKVDEDGWMRLNLPDAHSEAISNDDENVELMEKLGYEVVGIANDGMIEVIEDKFGNIHFEGHPEGLIISNMKSDQKISLLRNNSMQAIKAVFNEFLKR